MAGITDMIYPLSGMRKEAREVDLSPELFYLQTQLLKRQKNAKDKRGRLFLDVYPNEDPSNGTHTVEFWGELDGGPLDIKKPKKADYQEIATWIESMQNRSRKDISSLRMAVDNATGRGNAMIVYADGKERYFSQE